MRTITNVDALASSPGPLSPDPEHPRVQLLATRLGQSPEQAAARLGKRLRRGRGWLNPDQAAQTLVLQHQVQSLQQAWSQRLAARLAAGARHISGARLDDAIGAAQRELTERRAVALGYWPADGEHPQLIARKILAALRALAPLVPLQPEGDGELVPAVCVKLDLLHYDADLWQELVTTARQTRVRLHVDAQGLDTAEPTMRLIESAVGSGADLSVTLPARWGRSFSDAEQFLYWRLPIRLVKGQGGDPAHPRLDPREAFVALAERLAGRARHVGVATHDAHSARRVLAMLQAAGTSCALEQLRALPRLDGLADGLGLPVRADIAYGQTGLPYALREVLRRPAMLGWMARDAWAARRLPDSSAPPPRPSTTTPPARPGDRDA